MGDDLVYDRKTQPTSDDVAAFVEGIEDPRRRADTAAVLELVREVTTAAPEL